MMTPEQAVFAAIITCVGGAGLTLLTARWRSLSGVLAFLVTAVSAGFVVVAAGAVMLGTGPRAAAGWLAAGAGGQRIQVDGLTAIFLLVAAIVAPPASLFSIRYLRHYTRTVARYHPYFLLLLAAIYGLLATADTMWWFLIFWQLLVFSGYALLRFDRGTGAGGANRYAIMLELACAAVLAGTGLLCHGASAGTPFRYDWQTIAANLPAMLRAAPGDSVLAFVLLLLGFGIALGLWPLGQMWLPHASPAAPAPVSVLLCGVVIKIGAYGLMRYFLFLAPAGAQAGLALTNWGAAIALLGTVTLFAGSMQALQQEHCKRLLAFHSIGQMGYILLALGTCLVMAGNPDTAAAAVAGFALLAALFHLINHSLFSSLLYFNAGSLQQATGTQNLNQLGGLMKFMPLTGLTALIGSLSISGVPLFNGFASKWAIFAAVIQGAGWAWYLAICAVVAILTSGLTLASFIKFFGTSFLSRTSELVTEKAGLRPVLRGSGLHAHTDQPLAGRLEVAWSMQLPQMLLAALCVLLGLAPGLVFGLLRQAIAASPQTLGAELLAGAPVTAGAWTGVAGPRATALFVPLALAAVLGMTFLVAYGISRLGSAPRRSAAPWLCGYAPEAECQRYIAHNFYSEIKRHFRWLGGVEDGKPAVVKGRTA